MYWVHEILIEIHNNSISFQSQNREREEGELFWRGYWMKVRAEEERRSTIKSTELYKLCYRWQKSRWIETWRRVSLCNRGGWKRLIVGSTLEKETKKILEGEREEVPGFVSMKIVQINIISKNKSCSYV